MTKQRAMKVEAKLDPDRSKTLQSVRIEDELLMVGNPALTAKNVSWYLYPFITKQLLALPSPSRSTIHQAKSALFN